VPGYIRAYSAFIVLNQYNFVKPLYCPAKISTDDQNISIAPGNALPPPDTQKQTIQQQAKEETHK